MRSGDYPALHPHILPLNKVYHLALLRRMST